MTTLSAPPSAPRDATADTFHGITVADPYRPLEDAAAPATKAWVAAQNVRVQQFVAPQQQTIAALTGYMQKQMDYPRKGLPSHYGKLWFRVFNPGLAPQPVHQVADSATGPWRTILDPQNIDPTGVTSISEFQPTDDGQFIAYALSVGGDDMCTLYVMDTATGQNLPDVIRDCRWPSVEWDKDGNGFHYSYAAGDDTRRRVVKHHSLGTDVTTDTLVFAHEHPESIAGLHRSRHSGSEYIIISIGTDNNHGCLWRGVGAKDFVKLVDPLVEDLSIIDLIDGRIYAISKRDAARGQLVSFDPLTPNQRTVLVAEEPQAVLDGGFFREGRLFLNYNDDTADRISICALDGTVTGTVPLPTQSVIGFARDNPGDTGCYVRISSFLTPGTSYFYDYRTNQLEFFMASEAPETLEDCIVERVRATSKDGTQVPMTIIRHPDTKLDGTAATRLYGYGGFNVPLGPAFSPLRVMAWVRQGGIFVQTNLRGGGEFGTAWYDGGRQRNKQNTFDDFAACADWLIANNYSSGARIVSEGGSNGGLLVLATMLQRPEVFGAVISHVPVTDMLRYDLHTYGAYWKSDYGDPKNDAEDFGIAMGYSPLHAITDGAHYPPHLVLTADKDTRVVPMHSYKFVATMQEKADAATQSYLRVEVDAGHGAGTALQKTIDESALIIAFCQQAIGPIDQKAYAASR